MQQMEAKEDVNDEREYSKDCFDVFNKTNELLNIPATKDIRLLSLLADTIKNHPTFPDLLKLLCLSNTITIVSEISFIESYLQSLLPGLSSSEARQLAYRHVPTDNGIHCTIARSHSSSLEYLFPMDSTLGANATMREVLPKATLPLVEDDDASYNM